MDLKNSDMIAASWSPGFGRDLTSWELFINQNRWLRQKVCVFNHESEFHKQVLWFWTKLSRKEMAKVREIIDPICFDDFKREYSDSNVEFQDNSGRLIFASPSNRPTYTIAIRLKDRVKQIEVYDLPGLAEYLQNPKMICLFQLWQAVTLHAPFGKVPLENGLPKTGWKFWR